MEMYPSDDVTTSKQFTIYIIVCVTLIVLANHYAFQAGVSINRCIEITGILTFTSLAKGIACWMMLS